MAENELKQLQTDLFSALGLYTDLTEAVCEILMKSQAAPLTPADRGRLIRLRRQEVSALKHYLSARLQLMTALSLEPIPEIRSFYNAVVADRHPEARAGVATSR